MHEEWERRKHKKKSDRRPPGHELDILNGGYAVMYRTKKKASTPGRVEQMVGPERQ
jgi:hypothetical protein